MTSDAESKSNGTQRERIYNLLEQIKKLRIKNKNGNQELIGTRWDAKS